ncbi:MAG TPA: DUF3303 family protein [Caldilineae bacterium]|nr:DUF3303 family protein [Caldilineae bacterium]
MLFAALLKVRAGTIAERAARRVKWQPPEGVRLVAEYWLQTTDPSVISIIEADNVASIMAAVAGWDDVFDVTIVPAITAEEGLELARQIMQE